MDYPNSDEEFELMHADELEAMREDEEDFEVPDTSHPQPKSRRSLNFEKLDILDEQLRAKDPHNKSSEISSELIQASHSNVSANSLSSIQGILPFRSNKRAVEDLFGDIDDLELEIQQELKKSKLEENLSLEEKQFMTIEKILKLRKEANEVKLKPSVTSTSGSRKQIEDCMAKDLPKWPFIPVTFEETGTRFFLRIHSQQYLDKELEKLTSTATRGGLLSEPFEVLQKQAIALMAKKTEQNIQETGNKSGEVTVIEKQVSDGDLWVERYKPRNYFQLLSDEGTNRSLLQWLKLWDKAVFNRERKVRTRLKAEIIGSSKSGRYPELSEELDEMGRPHYKVALLCGPPGLGKTTLAHMIAKQAGYSVVELNASDDRSPELFRTALEAATQMKSVMGENPRPNCLILDEIDGAPLASIEVLVKYATDKSTHKGKKGKKGEKSGGIILKRPIICICNDIYVPALRPLRQIAFTLHVPPISSERLGERLAEVCRGEGMRSDLGVMIALAEKSGRDVRASLSALQLLRASPKLGLSQVKALPTKDIHHGLFTVWQNVFQKDKKITDGTASRISPVVRMVQSCGEYERLCQGVHENFLNLTLRDLNMKIVYKGLLWFCFFDLISKVINETQNYVLYPYLPFPFGAWHLLFSAIAWPKLSYPSVAYEMTQRSARAAQVMNWTMSGMPGHLRAHTLRSSLLLDVSPYLLHIIVPQVRPVASQLYTPAEQKELTHVVSVMIDYNLTYTQERSQDGNYVYNLDPNLEEIVRFKDSKDSGRILSYAGKQMLHREIDLEKMRRAEANLYKNDGEPSKMEVEQIDSREKKTVDAAKEKGKKNTPLKPKVCLELTPKTLKRRAMEGRDFFGRVVESNLNSVEQKAKMDDIVKSSVWFHFKEGYSNAVRKNVLMSDLL